MIEIFKFESKDQCLTYLKDLFAKDEYRNINELMLRADLYGKHNKELYDFFIEEGKKLLSSS